MKAALANAAWLAASVPAWLRFVRALHRPEQTQRAILRSLLARNARCEYGRAHDFGAVGSYEDFRQRVPVVEYEALEPWLARVRDGQAAVLTCEPLTRLVPTSGTASGRKLIPFTASLQREFNAAIGPWIVDLRGRHPSVAGGPAYWSISPAIPQEMERGAVPVGFEDDSAYLGGFRRKLVEAVFAVPPGLAAVRDVETSRYLTLLSLLRERELRLISVWHPSFLTLLLDALPRRWDELLADMTRGLSRDGVTLTPRPSRAEELRGVGPADPHAIWPRLRVVSCWGDAQAGLALADLHRRWPQAHFQSKGLLATEAFVSIPFRGLHPLAVTSHFFEFAEEDGQVRLAHELRIGARYEVVVTTGAGLWRYRLGDWVEVDGFVGATPSLRFVGRGGRVSDRCGEKLAEPFVARAIASACSRFRFAPGFAMLAPSREAEGRWSYCLFTDHAPPAPLGCGLDAELRANPHYALCRDLGQLGELRCIGVGAGAYEDYCRVRLSEGARLGDIKPEALSIRADWVEHFGRREPAQPALGSGATGSASAV